MKNILMTAACGALLMSGAVFAGEKMDKSEAPSETPRETLDFSTLDADADGYVSEEEAGEMPMLNEKWSDYDADGDGQMSEDEFSAFEEAETGLSGPAKRLEEYGK